MRKRNSIFFLLNETFRRCNNSKQVLVKVLSERTIDDEMSKSNESFHDSIVKRTY